MDSDYSAWPRATYSSNGMNDCIHPRQRRNPAFHNNPFYSLLGNADRHLKQNCFCKKWFPGQMVLWPWPWNIDFILFYFTFGITSRPWGSLKVKWRASVILLSCSTTCTYALPDIWRPNEIRPRKNNFHLVTSEMQTRIVCTWMWNILSLLLFC